MILIFFQIWNFTPNDHIEIIAREEEIDPVRVPSVFKDQKDQGRKDDSDDDPDLDVLIKPRVVSIPSLLLILTVYFSKYDK